MKKKYFRNLLNNCQKNCKKNWEVINLILNGQNCKLSCTKILHNDTTNTNKNDNAEAFNNYFTNAAINISSEIPHIDIEFRDFL